MNEPVSLLELPTEILDAILSDVRSSRGTLKALTQTCHRLHAIAAPYLLGLVVIRNPQSMSRFRETAASSPRLTSLIREVQVHYHELDEDTDDSPEDIDPVLSRLVNLESLVFRSSWFSWNKINKMQLLAHPQETLPALRSVILSLDYGYDWTFSVGKYGSLLNHPTLERLTIAGAHFSLRTENEHGANFRSTRLEELTLLNCDLHAWDIEDMLRYPRHLKHFTIKGQEERTDLGIFCDLDRRPYIDALWAQSSSLETLDLDIQMVIGDIEQYWLREASTLEWAKLLPTNLQHLTFRNDCGAFPILQMYEAVRDGHLKLRSLTCQIASNLEEDGSHVCSEWDLGAIDPHGVLVFRSPDELMSELSPDGVSYSQGFKALDVEFSIVEVPRTEMLPGYDSCPCPCWKYKHRHYNDSNW